MKFYFSLIVTITLLSVLDCKSQDLEPRFLSSIPVKTNIGAVLYGYSTGAILLDNSLPLKDLNSKMNSFGLVYVRSFKFFDKLAKFDFNLTYSSAEFNGLVDDTSRETHRTGFGDPNLRFSVILIGDKPLSAKEFHTRQVSKFKLGVALKFRVPIGQYDNSKLINLGSNRFGFHFKTAASYRLSKRIILEGHVSSWFFTNNNSFYSTHKLSQQPLISGQLNVAYLFSQKTWASASIGGVSLGQTSINDIEQDNEQDNSRYGFTFSHKLNKKSGLKFIVTNGLSTNIGTDFTSYIIGYQFLWLDKR